MVVNSIFPFTGISQKLPCQGRAALNLVLDTSEFFLNRIVLARFQAHQADIRLDTHQQVVEIMGNTASQGANGLHFLRHKELFLQLCLFRNIFGQTDNARDAAFGI